MVVIFSIFIIILFIVLYNILLWIQTREQTRAAADEFGEYGEVREGLKVKDPFKEISKGFKKIPDGFKKAQKEASKGFNKLGNTIKKQTTGAFNKVGGEIKKAANEAKKGTKMIEGLIKKELNKVFKTLKKEITKPFDVIMRFINQIKTVFDQIKCFFTGIGDVFIAIGNYFICGVEKIVSLPSCFLYYFLDILYNIFIALPIWFLTLIFPPLKQIVKMVYGFMMQIDSASYKSTGFHIFRYQEGVLNRCYRCKGLTKIPNIAERCFSKKKKKTVEIKKSSEYCGVGAPASAKKECAALKHTAITLSDKTRTRAEQDAGKIKTKLEEKVQQTKNAKGSNIKTKTITEDEITERFSYGKISPMEITIEKK